MDSVLLSASHCATPNDPGSLHLHYAGQACKQKQYENLIQGNEDKKS